MALRGSLEGPQAPLNRALDLATCSDIRVELFTEIRFTSLSQPHHIGVSSYQRLGFPGPAGACPRPRLSAASSSARVSGLCIDGNGMSAPTASPACCRGALLAVVALAGHSHSEIWHKS
jgi:hypothetical protein